MAMSNGMYGLGHELKQESIRQGHFLTRAVTENVVTALEAQQHVLQLGWCVCQVLLGDVFQGLVVSCNGNGSTIDVSPESLSPKDNNEHLSFYVGVMAFSIGEGFAGKGHVFVVLKECQTKEYL